MGKRVSVHLPIAQTTVVELGTDKLYYPLELRAAPLVPTTSSNWHLEVVCFTYTVRESELQRGKGASGSTR